jgi:RNA polymerase sigma factor (sigma-70 family)
MNGSTDPVWINAELLGRLLDEHGSALALYAAHWTEAADDCVQEALVELARQATAPQNLRAWLFRVVKHRALNSARSARRRHQRESQAVAERNDILRMKSASSANTHYLSLHVTDALERLEAGERELVVMRVWGGLSYEEIAATLAISTSSAHRQYQRALEKLRHVLEPPCSTSKNPPSSSSQQS